jgi:hypothetical protein
VRKTPPCNCLVLTCYGAKLQAQKRSTQFDLWKGVRLCLEVAENRPPQREGSLCRRGWPAAAILSALASCWALSMRSRITAGSMCGRRPPAAPYPERGAGW